MAMIGMRMRIPSVTAMRSMGGSTMKSAAGSRFMLLMPPK
jgi:hypothetical protein